MREGGQINKPALYVPREPGMDSPGTWEKIEKWWGSIDLDLHYIPPKIPCDHWDQHFLITETGPHRYCLECRKVCRNR